MGEGIYAALESIGYGHPLHPVAVHLPAGLVIAVFLFSVAAMFLRHAGLAQTARHCALLALLSAPVAAAAGLLDWQHFYGGAWLPPFIIKMVLAFLLIISLGVAVFKGMKKDVPIKRLVPVYLFCLAVVVGLGYFGAQLVYGERAQSPGEMRQSAPAEPVQAPAPKTGAEPSGKPAAPAPAPDSLDPAKVDAGRQLFSQKCSFCHHADSTDNKIGPGLKGILKRDRFPVSNWPATEENLRRQIKAPFDSMPPFPDLPQADVDAIVAYLKTL
ncbi:MAG: c-type cytochrome [Desulfobacterales bacterium]|jgi:uncharacterized membrane protein